MKDILIGSIMGSAIAEIATLPICTTKTIYQSDSKNVSILSVAKNIYNKGGILGFYKGTLPAFWAQVLSSSSKIVLYNFFINNWHLQLDTYHFKYIVCGILSAVLTAFITHPLDVCRISLQNSTKIPFIYLGWTKSFYKAIIGGATFLPIKSFMGDALGKDHLIFANILTAIISTIIITPVDYLKTFVIANNNKGSIDVFRGNPFKGLSLNLLRIVPHFTIMMTICDLVTKGFNS